ncbi:hemerythrin domain-containing protein [Acidiferrimicrobium sp. IK]|uniref:hemerythrin domain-containing protein n=1 Tax=Acidiferrimicrobium sp. IK TaxID=2871700 RepID=UPI0021CB1012|nr:hemerythrin domain-containing protein [Acidiferrimicrobium sp. IK]MCU4184721.1 hemerythrin domain-containing protein [Acidiferrimicrobium sp. IK]
MDAIELLTADHQKVETLFSRFEAAGPRATTTKRRLVDQIITELSVHAGIEEMLFYPAVRRADSALGDQVLEALEEHHGAKTFLAELERLPAQAERFDAKVAVLIEQIRHHVKEEEGELFPAVRKVMSKEDLADLGEALENAKATAPTRAHPHQPDVPPFNIVMGLPMAIADRAVGAVRHLVSR